MESTDDTLKSKPIKDLRACTIATSWALLDLVNILDTLNNSNPSGPEKSIFLTVLKVLFSL
jgi:hypothetical protein